MEGRRHFGTGLPGPRLQIWPKELRSVQPDPYPLPNTCGVKRRQHNSLDEQEDSRYSGREQNRRTHTK